MAHTWMPLLAMALALAPVAAAAPPTVAVLDSGIDAQHVDFADRTVERHSFASPQVPSVPVPGIPVDPLQQLMPDPDGQGTAVASRVAGSQHGVHTKEAHLVDLQVVGNYTGTQLDPAVAEAAARAMDWVLANHGGNGSAGTRIAILSFASRELTGPGVESVVAGAEKLWRAGVLVVVPAGNGTLQRSPYVLSVAMAGGSGCTVGLPAGTVLKPDVAALGEQVKVALARDTPADPPNGEASRSGAVYAAAEAASLAALIWDRHSGLPLPALMAILRNTANDHKPDGPDSCTGHGLVDASRALEAAAAWRDPRPTGALPEQAPGWAAPGALLVLGLAAGLRRRAV